MMKNERPAKLCPIPQKGSSMNPPLSSKRNIIDFAHPVPLPAEKPAVKQRNTTGAPAFALNNLRQDPTVSTPLSSSKDKTAASFDRGSMRQRGSLNPSTNAIPLLQPRGTGLRPSVPVNQQPSRETSSSHILPPAPLPKSNIGFSQNNSQLFGKSGEKTTEKLKEQLQAQAQQTKLDSRHKAQKSDSKLQLTVQSIETPKLSPNTKQGTFNLDASPNLTPVSKSNRNRSYFLTNNSNANAITTNIYDKSGKTSKVSNDLNLEPKGTQKEPLSGGVLNRFEVTNYCGVR